MTRPPRTMLMVMFDVTDLPQHEIDALAGEAMVQGEASDEYAEDDEESGHRDVQATSAQVELP